MTLPPKPSVRPGNPRFSSGPCTKHPGWSLAALKGALLGRYHRAKDTRARLELGLAKTRELLKLPAGCRVGRITSLGPVLSPQPSGCPRDPGRLGLSLASDGAVARRGRRRDGSAGFAPERA